MENTVLPAQRRSVVGVLLKCCNVYVRAHLNMRQEAYVGSCPRCAAPVRIGISAEGTRLREAA
jgi:hypothetical protein